MANNFIARSTGVYSPGEYEPKFYENTDNIYTGAIDNPDAYYNYLVEYTRCDNLDREVSDERNDSFQNRVMYNKLVDVTAGYGPRSNVREMVPSTELYQEVGFEKYSMRPGFIKFRNKLIDESKKHMSKYENMPNIIEPPMRKDLVRFAWNNNPRMRGKVEISAVDDGYTYLRNHTIKNKSFDDKLMSSIMMETDITSNKNTINSVQKYNRNSGISKTKPNDPNVEVYNNDIEMDLPVNQNKQNYNKQRVNNVPDINLPEDQLLNHRNVKSSNYYKPKNNETVQINGYTTEYFNSDPKNKNKRNIKGASKQAEVEYDSAEENRSHGASNRRTQNNLVYHKKGTEGFNNNDNFNDIYKPSYKKENNNSNRYMGKNMVNNENIRDNQSSFNDYTTKINKKYQHNNMLIRDKNGLNINEDDNLTLKV